MTPAASSSSPPSSLPASPVSSLSGPVSFSSRPTSLSGSSSPAFLLVSSVSSSTPTATTQPAELPPEATAGLAILIFCAGFVMMQTVPLVRS